MGFSCRPPLGFSQRSLPGTRLLDWRDCPRCWRHGCPFPGWGRWVWAATGSCFRPRNIESTPSTCIWCIGPASLIERSAARASSFFSSIWLRIWRYPGCGWIWTVWANYPHRISGIAWGSTRTSPPWNRSWTWSAWSRTRSFSDSRSEQSSFLSGSACP